MAKKTKISKTAIENPDNLPEHYSHKDLGPPQSLDERLADSEKDYKKYMEICYETKWHPQSPPEDKIGAKSRTHFEACYQGDVGLHEELLSMGLSQPVPDLPDSSGTVMFDLWSRLLTWTRKARALLAKTSLADRLRHFANLCQERQAFVQRKNANPKSRLIDRVGAEVQEHWEAMFRAAGMLAAEIGPKAPTLPDPAGTFFERWSRLLAWAREAMAVMEEQGQAKTTPTVQGKSRKTEPIKPQEGEWSDAMPKTKMRLAIMPGSAERAFNDWANNIGIQKVNRSNHRIRLDTMPQKDRERFERNI